MGKDYPLGYDYFRARLKSAFIKNKEITNKDLVEQLIMRGEFVERELKALYMLKKYRTMKKRYYDTEDVALKEFEKKCL